MKLCRYGRDGYEKPGMIDAEGKLRDLSKIIDNLDAAALSPRSLKMLSGIKPETLPLVTGNPRFGVPYTGISKYVAIGLNYSDHAAEAGMAVPSEPIIFMKATTSICGPNDDTIQPRNSTKLDWEVELAFVIGKRASYVDESQALDYLAGYALHNDYSERDFQLDRCGQWVKGKSCDSFAPLGPFLATPDELSDVNDLRMWLTVNGENKQESNTSNLHFKIPFLICYLSQFMTLLPGDVISTGTPPGVGLGFDPPQYLKPGDVVELGIEGLGTSSQTAVAAK